MNKFYCNICEEEIILQNGKCPKCKTDWDKIINQKMSEDSAPIDIYKKEIIDNDISDEKNQEVVYDEYKVITEEGIKNNINFFLTWASIGKIFMIFISIIIAIISIIGIEVTDGYSLILLIASIGIVFAGIIFENSLKWKAYMLHTNMKKKK